MRYEWHYLSPSSTLTFISSPLQLPFLDEGYPMANITTQGRLRSVLCSNDGMIMRLNSKMGCVTWGRMLRFNGGKLTSGSFCQCRKRSNSWGQKSKRWSPEAEFFVSNDGILEEDPEFEEDDLSFYRGLVLDISYRPVNVVCWKRAICLEFMEKADVLEYYDQSVNSPSGSFYIPAVLRVPHLLQVVKRRRVKKNLSRKNILWRDNFMCQYCSAGESLTIDHILPITRGGEWTWENLVTACSRCNSTKGHKTPEEANMKLLKVPKAPKDYDIVAIPLSAAAIKMLRSRKGTPEEWQQYLSKPLP